MLIEVIRIERQVASCQLEDGHILDIDKQWLGEGVKVGDKLDFNVEKIKKK